MCSSTCATKSRKINHRLILAVRQRSASSVCSSGMGRAAPSATWDREWGDTHKGGGRGGSQLPIFLALFLTWSQLSHIQFSLTLHHGPKGHSAEGGTGCPSPVESLVCSTGVGHTLAFPRNKMEVGLPLILLAGLGSLHRLQGPRGLFLPSQNLLIPALGSAALVWGDRLQAVTWPLPFPKKPA